jgi:hypothetical protein
MDNNAQKNLARRYLLGDLPSPEQLTLEQEYFSDSEKFEQVWAVENELVDSYVRGSLTNKERELFERNYLVTSRHQQRVAVARNLLQAADAMIVEEKKATAIDTPLATSWWSGLLASWQLPQLAWGGAVAMAMLLLALGGWWYYRTSPAEQIAEYKPDPQPTVPRTVSPTPQSVTPPATTEPSPKSAPQITPTIQPAAPAVLAFVLGGALRDSGAVQPLPLPKSTKQVRLQMNLDGENYPNYQVKLRTAGGRDILTQTALRPTPNKKSVVVNIPASRLSQGDYVLTFSGVTSDNEIEEINQYFFRVIPK